MSVFSGLLPVVLKDEGDWCRIHYVNKNKAD